ncbi:MAG: YlbE-like family protein [bacterium]|nr:YlbE-like family protein [bacterium]
MTLDIQFQIKNNSNYQRFLREHSYWYKELNRNPASFKDFVADMKDKYQLRPSDKFNKMLENISYFQSFLDVMR